MIEIITKLTHQTSIGQTNQKCCQSFDSINYKNEVNTTVMNKTIAVYRRGITFCF